MVGKPKTSLPLVLPLVFPQVLPDSLGIVGQAGENGR